MYTSFANPVSATHIQIAPVAYESGTTVGFMRFEILGCIGTVTHLERGHDGWVYWAEGLILLQIADILTPTSQTFEHTLGMFVLILMHSSWWFQIYGQICDIFEKICDIFVCSGLLLSVNFTKRYYIMDDSDCSRRFLDTILLQ